LNQPPNGVRYRRLGGLRYSCFDGVNVKSPEVPENAQTPNRPVHALLGAFEYYLTSLLGTSEYHFQ
jgi:hypothetical protein